MKKLSSLFLIFLLVLSSFPAYAQIGGNPASPAQPPPIPPEEFIVNQPDQPAAPPATTQPTPPAGAINPDTNKPFSPVSQDEINKAFGNQGPSSKLPFPGPGCFQPSEGNGLSSNESQNILDLLKDGFVGEKITGNINPEKTPKTEADRDKLAKDSLLLDHPSDDEKVVNTKVPSQIIYPFEITQYLNVHIKGPFAFGIVLDDTLRAGRCKDFSNIDCFLAGKNEKYRNSDDGWLSQVKPLTDLGEKIKGFFSDENTSGVQFSEEERKALEQNPSLAAGVYTDGVDEAELRTLSRLQKDLIPNSIQATDFEAKIGTNCNEDDCVIQSYSLFDKYFNQWMSSEMVVSTFGPTFYDKAKHLFGWVGRRGGFFKKGIEKIADAYRVNFEQPGSFIGKIKLDRMRARKSRNGWDAWWQSMVIGNSDGTGYPLAKTQEFLDWWAKQDEFLHTINTVQKKSEFVRMLKDLKTYARVQQVELERATKNYDDIVEHLQGTGIANAYEHPEGKKALIEYGRQVGKFIQSYDDDIGLDLPDWFVRNSNVGLYDKGVKNVNTGEIVDLFSDHRITRVMIDKFVDTGSWKNFANEAHLYNSAFETDEAGNIILYGFDAASAVPYRGLSYSNLERAAKTRTDVWAQTDHGDFVKWTPTSTPFIQQRIQGNATLFQGNWAVDHAMTPEEFTFRIVNSRQRGNFDKIAQNVDTMLDDLAEKRFVSRKYWNGLDKLMAEEDEIIRSYFGIRGGIKWTVYPFGYWWAKKGFNNEDLSFYALPEKWSYIFFRTGDEKGVYDYSYVDFFANSGSDTGDLFIKVINALPYKSLVLDQINNLEFNPVRDGFNFLTGEEKRDEVENLAFFLTGNKECPGCSITIVSNPTNDLFMPFFKSENQPLRSYILEDTKSEKARSKGTTLIAYAHATNLAGRSSQVEGNEIDLAEALNNDADPDPDKLPKSCKKAVETLPIAPFFDTTYGDVQKKLPFLPKAEGIGGLFAATESLSFAAFGWPGIFSSIALQTYYAPKLHDCVDTQGGYYVHYFLPEKKEEDKQTGKIELSTEKASNLLNSVKDTVVNSFSSVKPAVSGTSQGTPGAENPPAENKSLTQEQVEKVGDDIKNFAEKAESNRIVQARLEVSGLTSGKMRSSELFYFWCGPGCQTQNFYKTTGATKLKDKNSDTELTFDYEKGQILKDGEPIVSNPDAVRLKAQDLSIPAEVIPKNLTTVCVEPSPQTAIEVQANGTVTVLNREMLECIRSGVLEQTGVPMNTNDLREAFGLVEAVVTTTHPNIFLNNDSIIAEGVPRKVAQGANAKIFIAANQQVNLSSSNDNAVFVGELQAIKFKNGIIAAKPDGCFVTWLRHHEQAILNQRDVAGIKPELTTSVNPENMCPEPAIDLQVVANPESSFSQGKVENFNKSMQKLGPFQIFETPTKRYVLYSERDAGGDCQDHLRVIDKATGEIQDFTGTAEQTPTGIKFTDDQGKEHTLDFAADNGVPTVSFDNQTPETLTSAQGRNGAFYYDPATGQWYAENAQLLPLLEAFREGIGTKLQDNQAVSTASGNVLNVEVGKDGGNLLNLPGLPENPLVLALFLGLLVFSFALMRRKVFSGMQE